MYVLWQREIRGKLRNVLAGKHRSFSHVLRARLLYFGFGSSTVLSFFFGPLQVDLNRQVQIQRYTCLRLYGQHVLEK